MNHHNEAQRALAELISLARLVIGAPMTQNNERVTINITDTAMVSKTFRNKITTVINSLDVFSKMETLLKEVEVVEIESEMRALQEKLNKLKGE